MYFQDIYRLYVGFWYAAACRITVDRDGTFCIIIIIIIIYHYLKPVGLKTHKF